MKYSARPRLALRLARLVLDVEPPLYNWGEYAALVPVPLHRVRQAERGFNQAACLAREIGKATGLPVPRRWLRRIRATPPLYAFQGSEAFEARQAVVQGIFRAKLPQKAQGRPLLLVDDIVTTSATASEAARRLIQAGAGRVDLLAVARAGRRPDGSYADTDDADLVA